MMRSCWQRRQQRARFRFVPAELVEIGRDDVLQEMFGVQSGDLDHRTIREMHCRHWGVPDLAFVSGPT
jgi:hypothetical protein